jgi:hypothetical protein
VASAFHYASVQMIDTSIVRVHQHGACIIRNRKQSMGRSRGGLTSKINALVDTASRMQRPTFYDGIGDVDEVEPTIPRPIYN